MDQKAIDKLVKRWTDFYESKSLQKEIYEDYIDYAKGLWQNDVPVIFDFQHLCFLLGLSDTLVAKMVNGPESFYRTFEIKKRSGGKREITAPYDSIKYVQNWIYENILKKVQVNKCAHGFVAKRSIVTNAVVHVKNKKLLKIDLKEFFPSIPKTFVVKVFRDFGYNHKVAVYLASICCYENCLPQGAPTSPALSNIIARHMDTRLFALAQKMGLRYSRYADDMAFSGENLSVKLMDIVKPIIEECGFTVNDKKVRFYNNKGSKILTGVSISNGKPRLPRDYRRDLEQELFYIRTYGYDSHVCKKRITKSNYLEALIGKLCYWRMIEPKNKFAIDSLVMLKEIKRQKESL